MNGLPPPIAVRSQFTAGLVDGGFVPGVTTAESVVCAPAITGLGEAEPVAVGLVEGGGPVVGVSEKSSTARPSSEPETSVSVQRIQNVVPAAMFSPLMVELNGVRSGATLPFLAPVVAVSGVTKFSAATPVHVPVVRLVALVLY